MTPLHACRFCQTPLRHTFVDLGSSPLSNAFLRLEDMDRMEAFYPLHTYVCENCLLVQLPEVQSPEAIFGDYAYFSSYSDSWLEHARHYVLAMTARFGFDPNSSVIEVASNDGYLLRFFRDAGVPVLGIEPARNVALVAQEAGIPTIAEFLGRETATQIRKQHAADLLIGNNVLAHVPDINDFVAGLGILLRAEGVLTMEFPHLLELMIRNEFDTIYHEHFSYWSLLSVEQVFAAHGLRLFDVEQIPTHGGSLRIYACHQDSKHPTDQRIEQLRSLEARAGLDRLENYAAFAARVSEVRCQLLDFLIRCKREGKKVVGYGAPAKGNTLLNYCGVRPDLLPFTVDRSPHKQGRWLPGTRIPIRAPEAIFDLKPDYVLILPWNLRDEIVASMAGVREWGGQFVVAVPQLQVF